MNAPRALLLVLPGIVLATGLAMAVMHSPTDQGLVLSVATLHADLERRPRAWVGQTVRVRGTVLASGCVAWNGAGDTICPGWSIYLLDRDGTAVLTVTMQPQDRFHALLRRLPVAGQLVPRPQVVRLGTLATYTVRLLAAPAAACSATLCYQALLLDAAL